MSENCIGERSGAKLSYKLAYSCEGIPKSLFIPTVVVILERFGANSPAALVQLRADVGRAVLLACGIPKGLINGIGTGGVSAALARADRAPSTQSTVKSEG